MSSAVSGSVQTSEARKLLHNLRYDGPASLVVFLVALPLSLGIAIASGAPLVAGLIAAVIGGIVAGSLGGSAVQVSGPAAGLTVVVAELIDEIDQGNPPTPFHRLLVAENKWLAARYGLDAPLIDLARIQHYDPEEFWDPIRCNDSRTLILDPAKMTVSLNDKPVDVTAYEFSILRALAQRPGKVLSREQLLDLAKGSADLSFDRSIDVHVSRLRAKLGDAEKLHRIDDGENPTDI